MLVLVALLAFSGVVMAYDVPDYWPATGTEGVIPTVVDPWAAGDAKVECGRAGSTADFAYKVDNSAVNGTYPTGDGNVITISNSDSVFFDWASNWPVDMVIVKASNAANLFDYTNAYLDTDVYSVVKDAAVYDADGNMITAPTFYNVSHVTFCYNEPGMCYEEETAWAEGDRYVKKGNWAMYVEYEDGLVVDLIADYTNYVDAGDVTFTDNGDGTVTIDIVLTGGAIFYYDMNDPLYDNNLKVQGYASAPNKTPSPGLFAWKTRIEPGSTTGSIVVPVSNFYGVHVDLALPVPCTP
jgi:hypothetical protein